MVAKERSHSIYTNSRSTAIGRPLLVILHGWLKAEGIALAEKVWSIEVAPEAGFDVVLGHVGSFTPLWDRV